MHNTKEQFREFKLSVLSRDVWDTEKVKQVTVLGTECLHFGQVTYILTYQFCHMPVF